MPEHVAPIGLVTGGNRGIGREVCRQLARHGMIVVLGARDAARAQEAAAELAAAGADVRPLTLDVADPAGIAAAAAWLQATFGRLDVLINNAAVHYDTWQRASDPNFAIVEEALTTNTLGPWRLSVACLPLLRRSAHPRVVNVSSGAGALDDLGGGTPAYSLSQAALNALTLMLAGDLRDTSVKVNAVCPGWVATDMGGAGGRPVADGAAGIVWAATLPDDGPSGGFFRDGQPIPW
jgi:NAD(P)-dependent dehydrogenase (short-subunit alcohol dehydrogenase family)